MRFARRAIGLIAVTFTTLGIAGCERAAVTGPASTFNGLADAPRLAAALAVVPVLTPYPTSLPGGTAVLCKNALSPEGHYTFTISAAPVHTGDQVASTVTLTPGQCAIIFNRALPITEPSTISIAEQIPVGATFRVNHVNAMDFDGMKTVFLSVVTMKVNVYHGAAAEFFNEVAPISLPVETPYPGSPSPNQETVCKDASSPAGSYTFNVSAANTLPGDQVATSATLQPGHCAIIYSRGTSSVALTNVTTTEVIPTGAAFTLDHIAVNDPDGPRNVAGPGVTLKVSSFHGAIATYVNQASVVGLRQVSVCKAGQVGGTFNFTASATGTIGTDVVTSTFGLASGACAVVFSRPIPGVSAASITITETSNANTALSGVTVNGSAAVVAGGAVVVTQGTDASKVVVFTNIDTSVSPPLVNLGAAGTFGILAATTVTCVTGGVVNGDIGNSPGTALTGFPPCTLTGTKHLADGISAQAQLDLTAAYNALALLPCGTVVSADLGGTTKAAGVYCSATGLALTGTLTLDGGGDPNAKFVFQAGSTLVTAGNIVLINGAQAKNVYFQVGSSATLGTSSVIQGNILALASITINDNVTLNGRALARNGAVTLGTGDTINLP